ncbi:MAG: 30S ribosomal protein S6 [Candidatus Aminicenantales bacterium]
MRQYETGFVLSPTLSEEETTQFIQQMAAIVAQKKGRLVRQDVWGKRRLAFTIRKFSEGVYVFLTYEGPGDISTEIERRFKQSDAVIRFLTVKKDLRDQARRKRKKTAEEAPRTPEAGAEAPAQSPAPAVSPAAEVKEEK